MYVLRWFVGYRQFSPADRLTWSELTNPTHLPAVWWAGNLSIRPIGYGTLCLTSSCVPIRGRFPHLAKIVVYSAYPFNLRAAQGWAAFFLACNWEVAHIAFDGNQVLWLRPEQISIHS